MKSPGIVLLGLGPGDPELLTRKAWDLLHRSSELYLRTQNHPVVKHLPKHLEVYSFDEIYKQENSFELVYSRIVKKVLELGMRDQGVIYALPGHPFVAEATSVEILQQALNLDIPVSVYEGISFIEPVVNALAIDLLPQTAIIDSLELANLHVPNFPPNFPAIIAQIHSKDIASEIKLTLMANYPDEHPVKFVHAAGTPHVHVEELKLYEIDRNPNIEYLTTLFIPPLNESTSFEAFQEIIAHLRAPDGCPWDRKQTHKSLRPYLLEETYELIAAMDKEDESGIREELGDLLLQIVLHAQIASEIGGFMMVDILHEIHSKIVQRHPHVFGDTELSDEKGVLVNWEILKAEERKQNGKSAESLLDGVARTLPALVMADQYQQRAARVGFDWPDITGVLEKIKEELGEFRSVDDLELKGLEIGDLLFSIVNLARWSEIDPESALREANARFRKRFHYIEKITRDQGKKVSELSLKEMEKLWQKAKENVND